MNFSEMNIDELMDYRVDHINRNKLEFDSPIDELIHILKYKQSGVEISLKSAENNNYTPREWYRSERNLLDELLWRCKEIKEKWNQ